MNDSDPAFERLLHLAKQAAQNRPAEPEAEPPFGFVTRVVAGWKESAGVERAALAARLQAMWFRRVLFGALAVMVITVGWSFKTDTVQPDDEMAIVAGSDPTADLP